MRNENGYVSFNLLAGGALLLAGYWANPYFGILGVIIMVVCLIVSIVTKVQEKQQGKNMASDSYSERERKVIPTTSGRL